MTKTSDRRRYSSLRDFARALEAAGELRRVSAPVSLLHEVTEIHRRVLLRDGPALLFERPVHENGVISDIPLLANLFGSRRRIELGLGVGPGGIADVASLLSDLRHPTPPTSLSDMVAKLPCVTAAMHVGSRKVRTAACQAAVLKGEDINLDLLPIQTCWPDEPSPLVTWPLVVSRDPAARETNVGIYRLQKLDRKRLIVRWLAHRGGAKHHREWSRLKRDMPIAIVIGADPATILSAVMPLPEGLSELDFSGLLRRKRTPVSSAVTVPLNVPANAEIVLEGYVSHDRTAPEGPYGDHTGYYNSVEAFPVVTLTAITMKSEPIYLSTYTGRPPDEPSVLGEAMVELVKPVIRDQFPEIVDFHMPPEACSYRMIVVSIDKAYPGQARRLMMGLWSFLPQFSYAKSIVVVDRDINIRSWVDVIWAIATRFDASRDLMVVDDTPIDYLDFASPKSGLGGKMGLDATSKIGPETTREWGKVLAMSDEVITRVDRMWLELGLDERNG
jgi:4-hydroxy-3-polyprenylbenzoate decarboxylase